MRTKPRQFVFREPDGMATSVLFFAASLVFVAIFAYYGLLLDGGPIYSLVMGVAFALAGVAEILPPDRRRVAGGLRVLAIGTLLGLLVLTLVAPGIVLDS